MVIRRWAKLSALLTLPFALPISTPARGGVEFISDIAWGSKWDNPDHGTPGTVTWSFVADGTTVDPSHQDAAQFAGGSMIGMIRSTFDGTYGAGAFDTAIQSAFDTWEAVADSTFVGPVTDSGLPVGHIGSPQTDIRIGAFTPVGGSNFSFAGAFGYGPPGDDLFFPDSYPIAGDILFNIAQSFLLKPGSEGDPVSPIGNDLENLALHEIGHAAFGLDHPGSGPGDVMYVGAGCCDFINRELSQDDIAGARWMYGPSDFDGNSVVGALDYLVFRERSDPDLTGANQEFIDFVKGNFGRLFDRWVDDFGLVIPAPTTAAVTVPEPAAIGLLALALSGLLAQRRRM